MKIIELKEQLRESPAATVRFLLPTGDTIPAHAHVTEVARIDKRFIDCGGTLRNDSICRLQTWFSDDIGHRLTAGKLLKILEMAGPILMADDLEVDVEHEVGFITQFPLESVGIVENDLVLRLTERRTACLAMEKCKPEPCATAFDPLTTNFREGQSSSKCCAE